MFRLIGATLSDLIYFGVGVILLTQYKKVNKPYIKWIAYGLIAIGIPIIILDIIRLTK